MTPTIDNLKCAQCQCTESLLWKAIDDNQQMCITCYEKTRQDIKTDQDTSIVPSTTTSGQSNILTKTDERKEKPRKSTRSTRYNSKSGQGTSQTQSNAGNNKSGTIKARRGRRSLYRRPPMKAPTITATTTHVNSLFYKGSYIQIGDIVSLCNSNNDTFYAQIRGLMIDSFCEKSAVLTWLLPTEMSPPPNEQFEPSTYIIGPEEEHPRLLSCMEFIMHAPSDYYHNKNTPYPPTDSEVFTSSKNENAGFIWTNIEAT